MTCVTWGPVILDKNMSYKLVTQCQSISLHCDPSEPGPVTQPVWAITGHNSDKKHSNDVFSDMMEIQIIWVIENVQKLI